MYLVGFEAFVAEYFCPAALVIGDVFCLSEFGVERVIAGVAECGADANAGDADEDDLRARRFAGLDDGADVGAGFAFRLAAEEVITADADDDQARRVFAQQFWQAGEGLRAGVTADAAVGNAPAAERGKAGGVGFGGACTVAVGERVAEGENGSTARQGGVFSGFFAASSERGSGQEEEMAAVHGVSLR